MNDIRNNHLARRESTAVIPRNSKQEEYYNYLNDESKSIVIATGPAGTGKTFLGTTYAVKQLKNGVVNKLLICRPAVSVSGENHGFLPGSIEQKMEPWLLPMFDILEQHWSMKDIAHMLEEKIIEVVPLMYMRGRSFNDTFIIFDESQNSTPEQMKMILTRMGENTRMIITGDLDQSDHKQLNGLYDISIKLKKSASNNIATCEFSCEHVERSKIVKYVLRIYGDL